jgi:hypothetical protein
MELLALSLRIVLRCGGCQSNPELEEDSRLYMPTWQRDGERLRLARVETRNRDKSRD